MKYYKLFAILILAGMMACSGEKKEKGSEESVETVLPDETNEVTVMKLNTTDFNHELISNGKLSARNFVDLKFESEYGEFSRPRFVRLSQRIRSPSTSFR